MFDLPFRLFPPALLGGLAIYLAVTILWLQPLVETRLADKHLIPSCEAALARSEATTPLPQNQTRQDLDISLRIFEALTGSTGLDQIPGVGKTIEVTRDIVEDLTPETPRLSQIDRASVCGCAADQAFEQVGYAMTLHVASARTHWPTKVDALPQTTAAIATSGACGALPWMEG